MALSFGAQAAAAAQTEAGSSTQAGDTQDTVPSGGDIIVTAQRRAERQIDVPISIASLDEEAISARALTSIDDLRFAIPGVTVQSNGNQRRIVLRGIGNAFGNAALIGVYLDEAPVTAGQFGQADLRTYDIERVEVLRGPQGTLYGDGSLGGTIRFITKQPDLDTFGFQADAAALFTKDGEPGQRIDAVINLPLVTDTLGVRVVGGFEKGGGWIDQPAADRSNINGNTLTSMRVRALWKPMPDLAVNGTAIIQRNSRGSNIGEDEDGNYTQSFGLTTTPTVDDDYDLLNLTGNYSFPSFDLISSTSYLRVKKDGRNLGFTYPGGPPPAPFQQSLQFAQITESKNLSQEVRLSSSTSGPLRWTVGAFYRDGRTDFALPSQIFGQILGPGDPVPTPCCGRANRTDSKSWAVFGDASYDLGRLTLGAGLRYFRERQHFTDLNADTVQSGTFRSTNPRLYAQYEVAPDANLYVSAAKGFRSGGFNGVGQPAFRPEKLWTYELGAKGSLARGALTADVALFYSDYQNTQIIDVVRGFITTNGGSAHIKGIEWAFGWRPASDLLLSFNGNYIHSNVYEIDTAAANHEVGDPLDLFPKYSITASAQKDFVIGARTGFVRLDYSRQGRSTYRFRSIGPWYFGQSDVVDILNANAELDMNDHLTLGAFAQNLLNDRGYTDPFSIEGNAARSRPRTVGILFRARY